MLAIVNVGEGSFALRVKDVLDNEELVIKPAAPAIMATGLYAGQTLPDSGCPMLLLDCAGIARDAGLVFVREAIAEVDDAQVPVETGVTALVFVDLDGCRRAVPVALLDRIEQVPAEAMGMLAGRMRLTIEGRIVPLVATGAISTAGTWSVLRLKDGETELAYVIAEAADIVVLPLDMVSADAPGPVAGAVLLNGEPVELLDPYWLFGEHGEAQGDGDAAPLCLLSDTDDGWMHNFVRPMLEAAGYRVTSTLAAGERADLVLTLDDRVAPRDVGSGAPVVRLRSQKRSAGDGSVYRYDRAALLGALADAARRRA